MIDKIQGVADGQRVSVMRGVRVGSRVEVGGGVREMVGVWLAVRVLVGVRDGI